MSDVKLLREKMALKKMELQMEEFDIRVLELQNEIDRVKEQKQSYDDKIQEKKKELGI